MSKLRIIATALAFLAVAGPPSGALAQGGCLSGGEGRQLLEQGQVIPFPDAMRRAGLSADEVVDVQLCQSGGGYVYLVRILRGGEVTTQNIPAS
jgi:hypothetical protein